MLKKTYSKTDGTCKVTFTLPPEVQAEKVYLCGEFNNWDQTSHKMRRAKGGGFSASVALEPGRSYRFRYWLDDSRWENDWQADRYLPNDFGTDDSVVDV